MKKIVAFVSCLLIAVALIGCGKKPSIKVPKDGAVMYGTIIELDGMNMIVSPIEGSAELCSSSKFSVPIQNMNTSPELQVGDILEIIYDGSIQEIYPACFNSIYSIRVIATDEIPSK